MRRILIEFVLFVLAVGGGGLAWWEHRQIGALEASSATLKQQLTASEAERRTAQGRMPELLAKEGELDAVRRAISVGPLLQDVETMMAALKAPSAEQVLGLAALRMLVRGKDNPETAAAFQRALELVDWPARLNALCAAQAGMALSGAQVKQLAECADPVPATKPAAEGAAAEASQPRPAAVTVPKASR